MKAEVENMDRESAYFRLQLTRPETIAYALSDSPVGWAAYMLDKWQKWTDTRKRPFETVCNRDLLLTEVMLFLVTDSIATSIWPRPALHRNPERRLPSSTSTQSTASRHPGPSHVRPAQVGHRGYATLRIGAQGLLGGVEQHAQPPGGVGRHRRGGTEAEPGRRNAGRRGPQRGRGARQPCRTPQQQPSRRRCGGALHRETHYSASSRGRSRRRHSGPS